MGYNSTNLKQVDGGDVIKQGDTSSLFSFNLLDENNNIIDLNGKQATIYFTRNRKTYLTKTTDVIDNKVDFTIDKILEIGTYYIEVHCAGYVFPSDDSVTLEVRRSGQKYVVSTDLITDTTIQKLSSDIEYLKSKMNQNQYLFEQVSPQTEWTITHNLIKYPSVTIVDSAANEVFGSVEYISTSKNHR
ncbi:phage protein [Streptococcus dysgalactiae]|nr:phage protein [Streptococcus dysgalactiae]